MKRLKKLGFLNFLIASDGKAAINCPMETLCRWAAISTPMPSGADEKKPAKAGSYIKC
ncbi:hypothetical protein LN050_09895 [Comamonadaceae bacterium M7527]|nr:hypothetical protein LN050_09895 [Comamonadaceae bacterium M7527]